MENSLFWLDADQCVSPMEGSAVKSQQQSHRSQYNSKIAHLSALSPVSKEIIQLRGGAMKAAAFGEFTVEHMDKYWLAKRQQQSKVKKRQ